MTPTEINLLIAEWAGEWAEYRSSGSNEGRIPCDYCHDDEALRRVLGRLTLEQTYKLTNRVVSELRPLHTLLAVMRASPLQKATALAQLIKEEKGTK